MRTATLKIFPISRHGIKLLAEGEKELRKYSLEFFLRGKECNSRFKLDFSDIEDIKMLYAALSNFLEKEYIENSIMKYDEYVPDIKIKEHIAKMCDEEFEKWCEKYNVWPGAKK
jgi:hypothetical protein